jgi:hypothetical protein
VQVDQLIWDHVNGGKTTWPKRRKQRPPPIDVGIDGCLLMTTLTSTSVMMPGRRTPLTPGTPWTVNTANAAVADMTPSRASPPVSRYNVGGQAQVYTMMPGTPSTPEPKFKSEPAELPGSLLLPSQGFPQSEPPVTPARQTFGRSFSDQSSSNWSSTPGLSTCSAVTTAEMEVKPTRSSTSTASVPKIGKPFSAMTAEELIQCLPQCSPSTIYNTWAPAMLREHQKIKNLLQNASEIMNNRNTELRDFGAVCYDDHEKILRLLTLGLRRLSQSQTTHERYRTPTNTPSCRQSLFLNAITKRFRKSWTALKQTFAKRVLLQPVNVTSCSRKTNLSRHCNITLML